MLNESGARPALRWLALAGACGLVATAQAAEPTTDANGVMTFPHARVVSMPVAKAKTASPALAPSQAGLKAYKDAQTGELVSPTAEQAAALEAAGRASQSTQSGAQSTTGAPTMIYPAQGGVGMVLDESTHSYVVVRKDASGKLVEDCVPGEEAAHAALKSSSTRAAKRDSKGATK